MNFVDGISHVAFVFFFCFDRKIATTLENCIHNNNWYIMTCRRIFHIHCFMHDAHIAPMWNSERIWFFAANRRLLHCRCCNYAHLPFLVDWARRNYFTKIHVSVGKCQQHGTAQATRTLNASCCYEKEEEKQHTARIKNANSKLTAINVHQQMTIYLFFGWFSFARSHARTHTHTISRDYPTKRGTKKKQTLN